MITKSQAPKGATEPPGATMPSSFAALYAHIVFSTHLREPWITEAWARRLYAYLGGLCRERGCVLLKAGGMPDHVHLLVSLRRDTKPSDFMRDLKAGSSKWVHDTFADQRGFSWQDGYGIFSVSVSQLERVEKYIENQAQHHRKTTFKAEFEALLRKHRVEYDPKYLWADRA